MIRKLRKKLITVLMCVVCLFLAFILVSMFLSARSDFERRSMNAMQNRPVPPRREAAEAVEGTSGGAEETGDIDGGSDNAVNPSDEANTYNVGGTDGALSPSGAAIDPVASSDSPDGSSSSEASEASRRGPAGLPTAVVLVAPDGMASVIDNQIFYITDDELTALALGLQQSDEDAGREQAHELRYIRRTTEEGTRYFFSDTYSERQALGSQILYSCVIGLLALALFFGVSLLISRWMVKPVERAWDEQRRFIADASHELKTPLTVILSNADMLIASGAVSDDRNRARLDNLRAESQRMKGLVEDLLALARSDSGAEPAPLERLSLSYIASSSALTLEPTVYDAGRELSLEIEDGIEVMGDAAKLRQLCDILLDNACKYSDAGSVITVRLECAGKREAQLSVSEMGEPLTPEECASVFERFYRADKSRGREQGYGLGLSIARGIVDLHGGRIWAQSEPPRVNTFVVRLPLAAQATVAKQRVG